MTYELKELMENAKTREFAKRELENKKQECMLLEAQLDQADEWFTFDTYVDLCGLPDGKGFQGDSGIYYKDDEATHEKLRRLSDALGYSVPDYDDGSGEGLKKAYSYYVFGVM